MTSPTLTSSEVAAITAGTLPVALATFPAEEGGRDKEHHVIRLSGDALRLKYDMDTGHMTYEHTHTTLQDNIEV